MWAWNRWRSGAVPCDAAGPWLFLVSLGAASWLPQLGARPCTVSEAGWGRSVLFSTFVFLPGLLCHSIALPKSRETGSVLPPIFSLAFKSVYTAFSLRTNIGLTPPPVDWACGPVSLTLPEPSQGHILCWATSHLALRCWGHFLSLTFLTCKMVKLVSVCRVVVRTRDDEWSPLGC